VLLYVNKTPFLNELSLQQAAGYHVSSALLADKAEYNFTLNPSHAASSGEFKFKKTV
jgi:hypothetical protein